MYGTDLDRHVTCGSAGLFSLSHDMDRRRSRRPSQHSNSVVLRQCQRSRLVGEGAFRELVVKRPVRDRGGEQRVECRPASRLGPSHDRRQTHDQSIEGDHALSDARVGFASEVVGDHGREHTLDFVRSLGDSVSSHSSLALSRGFGDSHDWGLRMDLQRSETMEKKSIIQDPTYGDPCVRSPAPVIPSPTSIGAAENGTAVARLTATDADTQSFGFTWSIPAVGADGGSSR